LCFCVHFFNTKFFTTHNNDYVFVVVAYFLSSPPSLPSLPSPPSPPSLTLSPRYVHDRNKTSPPLSSPLTTPRITVTRSNSDPQRGFTWKVTFHATDTLYDPPNMLIDVSGMSGYVPRGEVFTASEGVAPLAGTFRMGFRGVGHVWHGVRTGLDTSFGGDQYMSLKSIPIPWNATSEQMALALETMGAVENVEVKRSDMSPGGGFTWTVTFKTGEGRRAGWDATRYKTPYGLRLDNVGNLQPLQSDLTRLAGTERSIDVGYLYNTSASPSWSPRKIGFHGESAGAVYVYRRDERRYAEELKIRSQHTDSYDKFGHDVALWRHTLVVGAPHAEFRGYHETQSIVCSADSGAFTLSFLNHTTQPIPWNSTGIMLKHMLEELQPIVEVDVEMWHDAVKRDVATTALCTNRTLNDNSSHVALVTFVRPDRGDVPMMEKDVDHRTGVLHPEQSNLVGWATLRRGGGFGEVEVTDNVVQGYVFCYSLSLFQFSINLFNTF